ncbi:UNVERIFIED_CONTAM: hypothetical protein GTU68_003888 [Idotea baltica]|nr:hypothetical protein [Idotea baltica]
MLYFKIFNFTQ